MIINKQIQFVHIPRTGGRYVSHIINENNYYCLWQNFNFSYKNKDVPHLSYPENTFFYHFTPFKKFSIIRDPVDRFMSGLRVANKVNEEKINSIFKNQESFDEFINICRLEDSSNFFLPQVNFLDYKTKLWRFENKFENNFYKWLLDNFNLKIINKDYKSNVFTSKNIYDNKFSLNEKQKQYIKNYYYQDYKILDY